MPDYNLVIKSIPWKRGLKYLELGTGFALYPPYKHVEERPYISSYLPLLDERVVVYCNTDVLNAPRELWPEDYFGLLFGVDSGFIIDEDFQEAVTNKNIVIQEAVSTRENVLMLHSKRIDCYLNSRLSVVWALKTLKKSGEYEELLSKNPIKEGALVKSEYSNLGVVDDKAGNFPYKDDLVNKLSSIIDDMRVDGDIEHIVSDIVN
jgi:polar amino acid transport system substrate-binding protein